MDQRSDEPARNGASGDSKPELQRALGELESAVQRLATSAKAHLAGRAISAIEEAADRLQRIERRDDRRQRRYRSLDEPNEGFDNVDEPSRRLTGREMRRQYRERMREERDDVRHRRRRRRGARLYRVPGERRIAGVCAGLARRWGVENWVVRCAAVSGLVFMPQIVFIGYWVLYFVMDPRPPATAENSTGLLTAPVGREPIEGFDRGVSARDRTRAVGTHFDALEKRLRKMEGYVTSSRFELDRAMQEIGG